MSKPKVIQVKESLSLLKSELKKSSVFLAPRIKMLIELKKAGDLGVSKRALAAAIGVDPNSIQSWRSGYEQGGIELLLSHGRIGFKPSVISAQAHADLKELLNNPENGIQGYVELKAWYEKKHKQPIAYTTLVGYCIRHFKTKIKVARKSHVNKDEQQVLAFKKTLQSTYVPS